MLVSHGVALQNEIEVCVVQRYGVCHTLIKLIAVDRQTIKSLAPLQVLQPCRRDLRAGDFDNSDLFQRETSKSGI